MPDLPLEASNDHVARLAHEADPIRAVVELVWNGVDAEAWNVAVRFDRNEMDAITRVEVADDGHGIGADEVTTAFRWIGDSWKSRATQTKNGIRGLHGSLGEGRLRAFALGSRVRWRSIGVDTGGDLREVTIDGRKTNRNLFRYDIAPAQGEPTGTIFTAANDEQRSLTALQSDVATPSLRSHFAPLLLNNPALTITYDSVRLEPAQEIAEDTTTVKSVELKSRSYEIGIRIIEWKSGKHRALYYGPDDQHFVHEENGSDVESQFPFSAFVTLPKLDGEGFGNGFTYLAAGDLAPEPISDLWRAAREAVREHFVDRRRRRRRDQVVIWRDQGVYPYQGEPDSEAERAERAVFDVVSGALSEQIPRRNKSSAKLTLALLRDAIRHEPERLTTVLHEVVALKPDDLADLTNLLGETTLPAIIKSANVVANRNKFLLALNHLLFDPDDSPQVGERDHLHRMLEQELWIFGEGYNMMSSERGLTQVLRTHLKLEGLPDADVAPVKRWNGKTGRVDLHLAVRAQEHDRTRHLIVELKAPGIVLGRAELNQVEDYANVIVENPQFATGGTFWDVILLGTDLDPIARNRILDAGSGLFWSKDVDGGPTVRMFLRRWTDVLAENKRRLDFITTKLEHDPSTGESLDWLRRHYSDLLPEGLLSPSAAPGPAA